MRVLKRLCRLFKTEDLGGYGVGEVFTPVWGFIIPHNKYAQGAVSFDRKYSEYTYGHLMTEIVGLSTETRDNGGVYGAAKRLYDKGVNAVIEPHFNAYNGHVSGSEVLVLKGDKLSERYARLFVEDFAVKYDKKLRYNGGVKFVSPGDRGYKNLIAMKDAGVRVAILTELFFGDNYVDYLPPQEQAVFWENNLVHVADKPL